MPNTHYSGLSSVLIKGVEYNAEINETGGISIFVDGKEWCGVAADDYEFVDFPIMFSSFDRKNLIKYLIIRMDEIKTLDSTIHDVWQPDRNTSYCGMYQILEQLLYYLKNQEYYPSLLSPKYIRNSVTGKIYPIRKSSSKFDGDFFEKPN